MRNRIGRTVNLSRAFPCRHAAPTQHHVNDGRRTRPPQRHQPAIRATKRACVFVGPSLAGYSPPSGIAVFPPATRGALDAAVLAGYRRIGLIDGAIENGSRLPLRELKRALAVPGVELFGGASMGAIRATEFQSEGMCGIGRVYRLFRRGSLSDSDEVYVLHAPATLHYRCLTWPLVNIRYTLRALRWAGHIDRAEEQAVVAYMRQVPWFDRDRHSLSAAIYGACARSGPGSLIQAFESSYRDVKREDALLVISTLSPDLCPQTSIAVA